MSPGGIEPLLGTGLALASAVGWSGLDAFRKRLSRELSATTILLGFTAPQVPIHAAILLGTGLPSVDLTFFITTLIAASLTLAANLLFVRAVALSPLSLTVPYLSLSPAMTLVFGALLLGQRPGPAGLAGVATVCVGALLLNSTPQELLRDPLRGLRRERGSQLMLGVAALFAASTALDRLAIVHASEPAYALLLTASITLALLLRPGAVQELRTARTSRAWLTGGALITAFALLNQFFGYRFLLVGYVDAVKRAGGNFFAMALGSLFFKERIHPRQIIAILLMSLGVALLLLDPAPS